MSRENAPYKRHPARAVGKPPLEEEQRKARQRRIRAGDQRYTLRSKSLRTRRDKASHAAPEKQHGRTAAAAQTHKQEHRNCPPDVRSQALGIIVKNRLLSTR